MLVPSCLGGGSAREVHGAPGACAAECVGEWCASDCAACVATEGFVLMMVPLWHSFGDQQCPSMAPSVRCWYLDAYL